MIKYANVLLFIPSSQNSNPNVAKVGLGHGFSLPLESLIRKSSSQLLEVVYSRLLVLLLPNVLHGYSTIRTLMPLKCLEHKEVVFPSHICATKRED